MRTFLAMVFGTMLLMPASAQSVSGVSDFVLLGVTDKMAILVDLKSIQKQADHADILMLLVNQPPAGPVAFSKVDLRFLCKSSLEQTLSSELFDEAGGSISRISQPGQPQSVPPDTQMASMFEIACNGKELYIENGHWPTLGAAVGAGKRAIDYMNNYNGRK